MLQPPGKRCGAEIPRRVITVFNISLLHIVYFELIHWITAILSISVTERWSPGNHSNPWGTSSKPELSSRMTQLNANSASPISRRQLGLRFSWRLIDAYISMILDMNGWGFREYTPLRKSSREIFHDPLHPSGETISRYMHYKEDACRISRH